MLEESKERQLTDRIKTLTDDKVELITQLIETQSVKADAEKARLTLELAELTLKEYSDGVLPQTRKSYQIEIAKVEADVAKAKKRLKYAEALLAKAKNPPPTSRPSIRPNGSLTTPKRHSTTPKGHTTTPRNGSKSLRIPRRKTSRGSRPTSPRRGADLLAKKKTLSLVERKEQDLIDRLKKLIDRPKSATATRTRLSRS